MWQAGECYKLLATLLDFQMAESSFIGVKSHLKLKDTDHYRLSAMEEYPKLLHVKMKHTFHRLMKYKCS